MRFHASLPELVEAQLARAGEVTFAGGALKVGVWEVQI